MPLDQLPVFTVFNKAARTLQFLFWEDFGVVTTNFYDDYPTSEFAMAAENTT